MDTPTRTVGASVVDRRRSAEVDSFGDIVGQSGGFRQAVQRARLLSKVDAPVLLEGETGVARTSSPGRSTGVAATGTGPSSRSTAAACRGI